MNSSREDEPLREPKISRLGRSLASRSSRFSIIIELGGRPTTPEESCLFREAIARTGTKIARQLAFA